MSPVCRSSRTTRSRNSSQTPARTRSRAGRAATRRRQTATLSAISRSTTPTTPRAAAAAEASSTSASATSSGTWSTAPCEREPLGLAQQPGGVRADAEEPQTRRRGPGAVQVAGDEDDGQVADGRVEQRGRRHVGPEPVAEPEADERRARGRRRGAAATSDDGVRGGGGRRRRRAGAGPAPTASGARARPRGRASATGRRAAPAATSASRPRSDGGDPTVAQQDVDGLVAVHQAGRAQQDVRGGRYGPHVSTVEAGYDPTFLGPRVPLPVPAQTVRDAPVDALHRAARPGAPAGGGDGGEHRRCAAGGPGARRRLAPRPARPRRRAGRPGAVRAQRPRPRAPGAPSGPGLGRPGGGPAGQLRHVRLPERRPAGLGVQPGRAALGGPRGPRARVRAGVRAPAVGLHGTGARRRRPGLPRRPDPADVLEGRRVGVRRGRCARPRSCWTRRRCRPDPAADEVPALGPFRTFQVPVADVEELTGIDLGPLVDADVLAPVGALARPRALGAADRAGADRPSSAARARRGARAPPSASRSPGRAPPGTRARRPRAPAAR